MGTPSHKFQAPKGTRDWYPADMAVRRHLENIWREVSTNHGFEEVDGPTFEHLELYTAKSGPGIVSEIFGVFSGKGKEELEQLKQTGQSPFALRPEFTPTLARMYAARAAQLSRPTRWFCMPTFFRAERPQRGRLREFQQWNVDILGDDSPKSDAEIVAVTVGLFERLGLNSKDVTIKISHRELVTQTLASLGVAETNMDKALALLDRKAKTAPDDFARQAGEIGLDARSLELASGKMAEAVNACIAAMERGQPAPANGDVPEKLRQTIAALAEVGVLHWCEFDMSIVRGLAYYTGIVFEAHEASGAERAIAGGGRYDRLVEVLGGPPTPAVGIAAGDVVLSLVLQDKGLLKAPEEYLPRPDAFVIAASDEAASRVPQVVSALRRERLHARHSSKTTRNVGKLLGDASKVRARCAVILGAELERGAAVLKNLDRGGEQREIPLPGLAAAIRMEIIQSQEGAS